MSDEHKTAVTVIERQEVERVNPAIRALIEARVDPETAREMLALQREYEADLARKAYTTAFNALKRDMPSIIARDQTVAFGSTRYTHASLSRILELVLPHLTAHGFSLNWTTGKDGHDVQVTCHLTHTQGHSDTCTLSAPPDTKGSKSAAQGTMSTVTMLQRYTAASLLGLATADMPEPIGEPAPDRVDKARNQKYIARLSAHGWNRERAEEALGKPWDQWTSADLDELAALITESKTP